VAELDEPKTAAANDATEQPADCFKSSYGRSIYSGNNTGQDLKLRWEFDSSHLWIGWYDDAFGIQDRADVDRNFSLNEAISVQVSAQRGTGRFCDGSLQATACDQVFATAGVGRFNLKPYYNLNFELNGAITLGTGWRRSNGSTASFTVVPDDRLGTSQRYGDKAICEVLD